MSLKRVKDTVVLGNFNDVIEGCRSSAGPQHLYRRRIVGENRYEI
jgi:hypothetical protein